MEVANAILHLSQLGQTIVDINTDRLIRRPSTYQTEPIRSRVFGKVYGSPSSAKRIWTEAPRFYRDLVECSVKRLTEKIIRKRNELAIRFDFAFPCRQTTTQWSDSNYKAAPVLWDVLVDPKFNTAQSNWRLNWSSRAFKERKSPVRSTA